MKPIFVAGLPRACTTLFTNLMAQNPNIYATPTSVTPCFIEGIRNQFTDNPLVQAQARAKVEPMMINACRGVMKGWYSHITEPYVLDKNRGWLSNYNLLKKMYGEDLRVIVIVRELGAVLASMEKRITENPEYTVSMDEITKTSIIGRCDEWLNTNPVGTALNAIYDSIHLNQSVGYVRAEDLLSDPETTLKGVYTYLGLEAYTHTFKGVEQSTTERDEVHMPYGVHVITPDVISPSKGPNGLPSTYLKSLKDRYNWYYNTFYPELLSD